MILVRTSFASSFCGWKQSARPLASNLSRATPRTAARLTPAPHQFHLFTRSNPPHLTSFTLTLLVLQSWPPLFDMLPKPGIAEKRLLMVFSGVGEETSLLEDV